MVLLNLTSALNLIKLLLTKGLFNNERKNSQLSFVFFDYFLKLIIVPGHARQITVLITYSIGFLSFLSMQCFLLWQKYKLKKESEAFGKVSDSNSAIQWSGLNSYLGILVFMGLILYATTSQDAEQSFLTTTLISSTFFFVTVPTIIIIKNVNLQTFLKNQIYQTKLFSFGGYLISLPKNGFMSYNKTSPAP
jgi:hypothetical protein